MSSPRRKRERGAESADELDVSALRTFLRKEESDIRVAVNELVNRDLMERINATKALEAKVGAEVREAAARCVSPRAACHPAYHPACHSSKRYAAYRQTRPSAALVHTQVSYTAALETGLVQEVRTEMRACFSVGVRLEAWVNTFAPPLSAGGNVGVSAEVQEGIFSIIHVLTAGCGEAMQRMLAYEKEHAVMRIKCSDETIWLRYKRRRLPRAHTAVGMPVPARTYRPDPALAFQCARECAAP